MSTNTFVQLSSGAKIWNSRCNINMTRPSADVHQGKSSAKSVNTPLVRDTGWG